MLSYTLFIWNNTFSLATLSNVKRSYGPDWKLGVRRAIKLERKLQKDLAFDSSIGITDLVPLVLGGLDCFR